MSPPRTHFRRLKTDPPPRGTASPRSHQGYRLAGRTPAQALQEALGVDALPPLVPAEGEEVTDTAA